MTRNSWLGILVGTLIFTLAMWFALLSITTAEVVGVGILGIGIALASYAVAGFSGVDDPLDVGFRASMYALVVGGVLLVVYQTADSELFLVLAPLVAIGVGGANALAPVASSSRRLVRLLGIIPVCLVAGFVYKVDPLVYGVFLPLTPLVGIGFADRLYDRGVEVLEGEPPNNSADK
ncbi:MAG: hypothetical protein R2823_05670 [Acidimicrobiia bacterium]